MDRPNTLPGRLRGTRRLLVVGALLVVAALVAVGLTLADERSSAISDYTIATNNLEVALAEQTYRSVQAVDLAAQQVRSQLEQQAARFPDGFQLFMTTFRMHDLLVTRLNTLPQADGMLLVGADGRLAANTRTWPVPDIEDADRDFFQHFRADDDRGAFISAPTLNRVTGAWTIFLARRLDGPRGEFLGLVVGVFTLQYFEDLYRAVTLQEGGSVSLLRTDGTLLVHYPQTPGDIGTRMPPQSPWYAVLARNGGSYHSPGYFGAPPRIVSVGKLRDYPLVVDVTVSEDAALHAWRRHAVFMGVGAACAAMFMALLLRALVVQFHRLERSEQSLARQAEELHASAEALRDSERHVKEKSALLETTLEEIDQGIMMVDAERRVMVCNRRAMELMGLPPDWMATQPSFDELVHYQTQQGEFGADDSAMQAIIRRGLADPPRVYERRRPNGCVIEVHSATLAGGGLVRTYTDITARRSAEERVRFIAHHDFLTELASRAVFHERLRLALADTGRPFAVLFLDLDRFKAVNDTLGHGAGDRLLVEVAIRMRASVREEDLVARMGGDEFAILQMLPGPGTQSAALAERLLATVSAPYDLAGLTVGIGVSIGIALYPDDGATPDVLLRQADIALYRAKSNGRNTFRFFTDHGAGAVASVA
jgi:diguanylate cyclase (GGDEF)-like protein